MRPWRAFGIAALAWAPLAGCFLVYDFDYARTTGSAGGGARSDAEPALALAAIDPLVLLRERSASVSVRVARRPDGLPILLHARDVPPGLTIDDATISPADPAGSLTVRSVASAVVGTTTITVEATAGDAKDEKPFIVTVSDSPADPTFGDAGLVVGGPGETIEDITFDRSGRMIVLYSSAGDSVVKRIVLREEAGALRPLVTETTVAAASVIHAGRIARITVSKDGTILVADVFPKPSIRAYDDAGALLWSQPFPLPVASGSFDQGPAPSFGRIVELPDGRLLVGGDGFLLARADSGVISSPAGFGVVARLTAAGAFDPSFGDGGGTALGIGLSDMAVTESGAIYVCGDRGNFEGPKPLVGRLGGDGKPDDMFGDLGIGRLAPARESCASIALDGDAVVAALMPERTDPKPRPRLARLDGAGDLVTTFGDGGVVDHPVIARGLTASVAMTDGLVISAGANEPGSTEAALVLRDLATGVPDLRFGPEADGALLLPIRLHSRVRHLRPLAEGRVLIAGDTDNTWFLARILQ